MFSFLVSCLITTDMLCSQTHLEQMDLQTGSVMENKE